MKYDMDYIIYRREMMNGFKNMDPDELVDVLGLDTDVLMERLAMDIDNYIEQEYEGWSDMELDDEEFNNDDPL